MRICVRSKDAQKQLARTSLRPNEFEFGGFHCGTLIKGQIGLERSWDLLLVKGSLVGDSSAKMDYCLEIHDFNSNLDFFLPFLQQPILTDYD